MIHRVKSTLLACALVALFAGCTDHLDKPSFPLGLRLKSVGNATSRTSFSYNASNQQVSFIRSDNSSGTFLYDGTGRYRQLTYFKSSDPASSEVSQFNFMFKTINYLQVLNYPLINGTLAPNPQLYTDLIFDYKIRPLTRNSNSSYTNLDGELAVFTYTGDNLTSAQYQQNQQAAQGILRTVVDYEFDNKLNPFYGLYFPNDDPYSNYAPGGRIVPDDVRQYSRNNVTKMTVRTVKGVIATTILAYQYNNQGLPVSVTATGSPVGGKIGGTIEIGKESTFTYESL